MPKKNIEEILSDLYTSDPSLKQHDATLRQLVMDLMEVKPDTKFDETFRQDLRRKLMSMAQAHQVRKHNPLTSIFMKKFQLAGAGVAFVALLAVSVWYLGGVKNQSGSLTSMLSKPKITRAGDNAFGALSNVQVAIGRGGGGSGQETMSAAPSADSSVNSSGTPDSKMIAPYEPINFKYIYKGDELVLSDEKVDVLKRVKNDSNSNLSDFVNRISLGLIDMNSFSNSQLQSFNFVEDKDLGYMVNVSLTEGSININENWSKWAAFTNSCAVLDSRMSTMPCEPKKIDISQVPADGVLISATNNFLDSHSIPRANYGEPFVNSDWRTQYERATDKSLIWIPDVISVVYPLVIDGEQIYDESGSVMGLNVTVRYTPEVKVSSVWELTTQNYQSSSYEAETNVDRIMKLVSNGGFRSYYYNDPNARTVNLELGTPHVSLVKLWNYDNAKGISEELLVPALVFPVTNEPKVDAYQWYRKNVVVPLVKEILDSDQTGGDPVRIMPAGTGATEPATMAVPPVKI